MSERAFGHVHIGHADHAHVPIALDREAVVANTRDDLLNVVRREAKPSAILP